MLIALRAESTLHILPATRILVTETCLHMLQDPEGRESLEFVLKVELLSNHPEPAVKAACLGASNSQPRSIIIPTYVFQRQTLSQCKKTSHVGLHCSRDIFDTSAVGSGSCSGTHYLLIPIRKNEDITIG